MLETLLHFDQQLFFAINHGLSNPFFDWLMPILRNRYFWSPLYLFVVIYFIRQYGRTGIILIIMLALTFALTDSVSSRFIKAAVERPRPCNDPIIKTQVNSLVGCGTGYSFPSSHAANHFGLAMFMIIACYHKWKWILPVSLLWAFSIVFAQVYVGVHYPIDITAGAILGCLIGYFTGTIFLITQKKTTWKPGK
ncbi:MAG TPA: phosphatase PAP2 family protein [Sphingobacteriaceae bacterium]|nr:phosphatase PAP2 family protein [Sphingobacteriaceae bacterium]